MASWRIVCVKRWAVSHPEPHVHVVGVGTGERPDWADMRWTLDEVFTAMDEGDVFYALNEATGQEVGVEKATCPLCGNVFLLSAEGCTAESDLDALRECIYEL